MQILSQTSNSQEMRIVTRVKLSEANYRSYAKQSQGAQEGCTGRYDG